MDDRNLIAVAEQAAATSRVLRGPIAGCTILADDGRVFLGCRLEYEDPGLDQHPLDNALGAGRVQGMRRVVRGGFYSPEPGPGPAVPAATLRRLRELADPGFVLLCSYGTGERTERPLAELLAEAGLE
ncbi:MAG: hypothetical protein D6702_03870 [Planctomycetota bacterium]|nr:MAG: hypothetical protein D6702_03870 [Planctomycetota bacterium]